MNTEFLILRNIYEEKQVSQRDIAKALDISLGKVNQVFKDIENKNLMTSSSQYKLTKQGKELLDKNKVNTAIILADENLVKTKNGRYIPIGLREIGDEPLIEKNIKYLLDRDISDIHIIAGNLIEGYEYLVDKYNIDFIYDEDYEKKGSLAKLLKARSICENNDAYIFSSSVYIIKNIFHQYEAESFIYANYMDDLEDRLSLLYNSKNILIGVEDGGEKRYAKTAIMFLKKDYSKEYFKLLNAYDKLPSANSFSHEDALIRNLDILPDICVYKIKESIYTDIKKSIDFLQYDKRLIEKNKFPMDYVTDSFDVKNKDIIDIDREESEDDKKVFSFSVFKKEYENKRYMVRELDRTLIVDSIKTDNEKLYKELANNDLYEKIVVTDGEYRLIKEVDNGYRRVDISKDEDRKAVLHILRKMHNSNIKVSKELDVEEVIDDYVKFLDNNNIDIVYKDFKDNIYMVKKLIYFLRGEKRPKAICKCFITNDDVCYTSNGLKIQNIESVAMSDPFIDIASIASSINAMPNDIVRICDEYNNILDMDNVAMQNIDKVKARNMTICFLAIHYFIDVVKIIISENKYMSKYGDKGFKKYRLYKKCINYIQKNKVL